MSDKYGIPNVVYERVAELPYERFIFEKFMVGKQRGLKLFPVDDASIMTDRGDLLPCWNALSPDQQHTLIEGNRGPDIRVPLGDGQCERYAHVLIETVYDEKPGPRFYCLECAIDYLITMYLGDDGMAPITTVNVGDFL